MKSLMGLAVERNEDFLLNEKTRKSELLDEELCKNLKNAYGQLGRNYDCDGVNTVAQVRNAVYSVSIARSGWYNLDKYVLAATENRESMNYTDPSTGRQVELKYSTIAIKVTQANAFQNLQVYLIPNSLKSFLRMKVKGNGLFNEKLNGILTYKAIAIAFKGKEFYMSPLTSVDSGEHALSLNESSKSAFEKLTKNLSGNIGRDLGNELEYRIFQQAESARRQRVFDRQAKRRVIEQVIFPCQTAVNPGGMQQPAQQPQVTPFGR